MRGEENVEPQARKEVMRAPRKMILVFGCLEPGIVGSGPQYLKVCDGQFVRSFILSPG